MFKRFQEENNIHVERVKIDGENYLVSMNKNIVFDPKREKEEEAIGVLENGKIRKLNKEECAFVEAYRHTVRKGCAEDYSESEDEDESGEESEPSAESESSADVSDD